MQQKQSDAAGSQVPAASFHGRILDELYSKICPAEFTTHGTPISGDTEIYDAAPGICTQDLPCWNW